MKDIVNSITSLFKKSIVAFTTKKFIYNTISINLFVLSAKKRGMFNNPSLYCKFFNEYLIRILGLYLCSYIVRLLLFTASSLFTSMGIISFLYCITKSTSALLTLAQYFGNGLFFYQVYITYYFF